MIKTGTLCIVIHAGNCGHTTTDHAGHVCETMGNSVIDSRMCEKCEAWFRGSMNLVTCCGKSMWMMEKWIKPLPPLAETQEHEREVETHE